MESEEFPGFWHSQSSSAGFSPTPYTAPGSCFSLPLFCSAPLSLSLPFSAMVSIPHSQTSPHAPPQPAGSRDASISSSRVFPQCHGQNRLFSHTCSRSTVGLCHSLKNLLHLSPNPIFLSHIKKYINTLTKKNLKTNQKNLKTNQKISKLTNKSQN